MACPQILVSNKKLVGLCIWRRSSVGQSTYTRGVTSSNLVAATIEKPLREGFFFRYLRIADMWFSRFIGGRIRLYLHEHLSISDGSLWLQFGELPVLHDPNLRQNWAFPFDFPPMTINHVIWGWMRRDWGLRVYNYNIGESFGIPFCSYCHPPIIEHCTGNTDDRDFFKIEDGYSLTVHDPHNTMIWEYTVIQLKPCSSNINTPIQKHNIDFSSGSDEDTYDNRAS